ncbi:MAG: class I SAM-dependent methyltransferase [Pyrinomonadaceae bacterium]|nr:class I SAM-dependent methyltransferase [Pyrinomonadaceae bacterium]MBA3571314.1 class I SAM-dependent methyltransferase [Pyrinomonadaceae bacterium]
MRAPANLQDWFGSIDIYLFDQLLKGRFVQGMRVLDAGCGSGRNLVCFLRSDYEVFGVDQSEDAIAQTRRLASVLAQQSSAETSGRLPSDNFRVEPVERMSFADASFDVVLSSAVLHFARDEEQWRAMMNEMWRVLKHGGMFFARLASTIGMEDKAELIEGRRYHLPDGSDRFLVDEAMLMTMTESLGGEFLEPIKTVVVQNMRAMTTWVLRKSDSNHSRFERATCFITSD